MLLPLALYFIQSAATEHTSRQHLHTDVQLLDLNFVLSVPDTEMCRCAYRPECSGRAFWSWVDGWIGGKGRERKDDLFMVCLTTLSVTHIRIHSGGWLMDDEFEGIWKETVVVWINILFLTCLEGLRKTTQNFGHSSHPQGRNLNTGPSEKQRSQEITKRD